MSQDQQLPHGYDKWRIGDSDPRGETIKSIVGQQETFIVYFVTGGWLNWFYDADQHPNMYKVEAAAQVLLNRGRSWISERRLFSEFRNHVAAGMVSALSSRAAAPEMQEHFRTAEGFLQVFVSKRHQIIFLLSTIFASALLGGVLSATSSFDFLQISSNHKHFLIGVSAGGFGALLSVLTRFQRLEASLTNFFSPSHIALEGFIRIFLGASFGFLLILLQKAGILLSIADSNLNFIALGAVVAGFNERLVPSLLGEMEYFYGLRSSNFAKHGEKRDA